MKFRINWDALGISASIACAIHCALLPLILSSLPLFGINIIHHLGFEIGMIALAFAIGSYSMYHGYKRRQDLCYIAHWKQHFRMLDAKVSWNVVHAIDPTAIFFKHHRLICVGIVLIYHRCY